MHDAEEPALRNTLPRPPDDKVEVDNPTRFWNTLGSNQEVVFQYNQAAGSGASSNSVSGKL